jgi:hypothetical protein
MNGPAAQKHPERHQTPSRTCKEQFGQRLMRDAMHFGSARDSRRRNHELLGFSTKKKILPDAVSSSITGS